MDNDKENQHGAGADKKANDARVAPGIVGTTPLQSQEEADDGRDEDGAADEVELQNALKDGEALREFGVALDVDHPHDNGHGEAADGEINVEAPAPGDIVGKRAAEQRTGDGGDAPHAADETKGERAFREGNWSASSKWLYGRCDLSERNRERTSVGENHYGAGEQTGRAHAGNSATDDEGDGRRGNGAQQAADFKDEDGCEENPLDVEVAVDDTINRLQTSRREEIGRSIPALAGTKIVKTRDYFTCTTRLTISLVLLNWSVMAPRAGAIIVWSRATRKMEMHSATIVRVSFNAPGYSGSVGCWPVASCCFSVVSCRP